MMMENDLSVRPFALSVRGQDHHHDHRTQDEEGRTPADVEAGETFLHKSSSVVHALMDGRYRLTPQGFGGWRTLTPTVANLPELEIDIPLVRGTEDDLLQGIITALRSASCAIHHPAHPSACERMAEERHADATTAIATAIADGSIPTDDASLDSVWVHAGTPWSRPVIHCRARTGIIATIPIEDGVLHPAATMIIDADARWEPDKGQRPVWKTITWATWFSRNEFPDPIETMRILSRRPS